MIDCVHGLPWSLEAHHEKLYHSLRLAIGVWRYEQGRWQRFLNLNGLFNLELGSGCAGFYPVNPTLEECVKRLVENKKGGLPLDMLFPELCFEYTIFVFDNDRIKILVNEGQDRIYPAPTGDERAQLAKEATEKRDLTGSTPVILPDSKFVFRSHLNLCVAIPDLLLKLRFRHGDGDSPKWHNAPQAEQDLFRALSPATDYLLDSTKWEVVTMPSVHVRLRAPPVRRSPRIFAALTEGAQVPSKVRAPSRTCKTAVPAKGKAPASAPSMKASRIPRRSSIAPETLFSPQAQPRMRTRSQTQQTVVEGSRLKITTQPTDFE
ncbi:hypothetical protein K525DRAFT_192387 [Schizophyllum commune Loenen D]|nr:hypothetical protein K525DRAFT_192387 [Schizophyllum commune Loenen D]